jgi:adhesin/invasin
MVSGIPISWAVMHNGGSTSFASSTTDSSGMASVWWTLDTIAKPDSLRASIPSGDAMLVIAMARHGTASAATKISGDSQTVALGDSSEPFIVKLADRYGNPISGAGVGWIVNGGGTLSALTTVTDANGTTRAILSTDTNAPGARQIVATYGILPASTFTLTATATTSASAARRIRIVTHPIP